MFARVVIDTGATSSIDSLDYEIPDGLAERVEVGSCVLVPLASRQAVGYVIGITSTPAVDKTRPILAELESPVRLTPDLLDLACWISRQYLCPLPRVVAGILPGVMHCKVQTRVAVVGDQPNLTTTPSERVLLDSIASRGGEVSAESLAAGGDRAATLRALRQLEKKGVLKRTWSLVQPAGKPRVLQGVRLAREVSGDEVGRSLTEKQWAALKLIADLRRPVSLVELSQRYGVTASPISSLRKKGLIESADVVCRRNPAFVRLGETRVTLNQEQQSAVDAICASVQAGEHRCHLLHGVTASGKTEVYLRCIERTMEMGRTALVLLPEIALTTQVMNIFKSRFGDEVAVLHSALSAGERCDEWARTSAGKARVVLGARSAVFAPLSNLGLVVVDEEHESSYKQDTHPRYNARDVAARRARQAGAALVLGSATPSIESFHLAAEGDHHLLTMPSRIENRPMPRVFIADLREEYAKGGGTIFSSVLEGGIRQRLDRREQVILLQNRRAYSTFLLCRDCGFVMRCPNCAVSLKFHSAERKVSCHHCDFSQPAPSVCPSCQGERIKRFGIGTERVEEETKRIFPEARVIRMDRDTTARKGSHAAILSAFRTGEVDILVGTQMIAKGLDFPRVTLVGVISADTSLNLPDFRASERTFQLLSQVAGRSGRGVEPGEVVIQTFDPENYAIRCAVEHDYLRFYEQELENRRELKYPPFSSLVNVISRDQDERAARERLESLVAALKKLPMSTRKGVDLIGPNPAVLSRLRGEYRWHLVLRSSNREAMLELLRGALESNQALRRALTVDVDPASML